VYVQLLHTVYAAANEAEMQRAGFLPWDKVGWGTYGQDSDPYQDGIEAAAISRRLSLKGWKANGETWAEGVERHWFVAAVTGTTVSGAKDSLMPSAVREVAERFGLRHADFHRRHTSAFIRQGEWFFVPAGIDVDPLRIHRREPLVRPGGG
jgi:hypothetical protein